MTISGLIENLWVDGDRILAFHVACNDKEHAIKVKNAGPGEKHGIFVDEGGDIELTLHKVTFKEYKKKLMNNKLKPYFHLELNHVVFDADPVGMEVV